MILFVLGFIVVAIILTKAFAPEDKPENPDGTRGDSEEEGQ